MGDIFVTMLAYRKFFLNCAWRACLRCDQKFRSWDRRHNRLCPRCRQVLSTQPSDEDSHGVPSRRRLTPDDSAAVG